jgi:membrane-bound serine protease (ClpP class)
MPTDNLTLAYALILLGIVLLAAELFIPTCGVLTALSIGAMVMGIAITFARDTSTGVITLIGVFVVVPVLMTFLLKYAPSTAIGKRLFLTGPDEDQTVANMPVNLELEQLRGRYGRTASALRPSGVVDFDGRRVDVLSEGALVEPGQWVRCIDVKAGKVIVREVEKPPDLGDLDTATFT